MVILQIIQFPRYYYDLMGYDETVWWAKQIMFKVPKEIYYKIFVSI